MLSADSKYLMAALGRHPGLNPPGFDPDAWLANTNNKMYIQGRDVGLATYEYEGLYNVHWYFEDAKGREAIKLARKMLNELFQDTDTKIVRGLTPERIKAARWLARQVGCTSQGIMEMADGPHEIFTMTRDQFYSKGDYNG